MDRTVIYNNILANTVSEMNPTGCVLLFAGQNAPSGWLLCDGSEVLIASYNELYNIISNTFGNSCNEYTFRVPDFRGRVPVGTNDNNVDLSFRVLADQGGEEDHLLSMNEMPSHTHTHNASGTPGNRGLILMNNGTGNYTTTGSGLDNTSGEPNLTGYSTAPSLVIDNSGGQDSHNNMQPFLVVNYIIKY
jgi:microcystin-dependent protein